MDLLLKENDNGTWRVTGLEPGGEGMGKKIVICTLFKRVQGIVDGLVGSWRRKRRKRP